MLLNLLKVILLAALTCSANLASAQFNLNTLTADEAFPISVDLRDNGATLSWTMPDGYYLYRDHFKVENADGQGVSFETPPAEIKDDPNFGTVDIYRTAVRFHLENTSGAHKIVWQGCKEDSLCYPPQSMEIYIPAGAQPAPAPTVVEATHATPDLPETIITVSQDQGVLADLSDRGGALFVVAGFFGFGILLSLTPCVFPMFPIVAGMVMGQKTPPGPRRGFLLSGTYVLAMASAFGALGVVAAWSGQNLQLALQSPPAIIAAALVFVALGLSMFGFFDIEMPQFVTSRVQRIQGKGGSLGGAAALGFTSALIVGPCVTAPLAGALLYIAKTGDVLLGALALFALGLGQGVPLLAIGVFGPRILPKSGAWMEKVKWGFGLVFIGIAIWLVGRIIPGNVLHAILAVVLFLVGLSITNYTETSLIARVKTAIGTVLFGLSGYFGMAALNPGYEVGFPFSIWESSQVESQLQKTEFSVVTTLVGLEDLLENDSRPALIYLTADWCTICRSIEKGPLSDPEIIQALSGFNAIKFDLSEFTDAGQDALDILQAAGPPAMIFLDDTYTEVSGTRLTGEFESKEFLHAIRTAQTPGR